MGELALCATCWARYQAVERPVSGEPTPEDVSIARAAGISLAEISREYDISLRETKKLLKDAERSAGTTFARDFLIKSAVPKALMAIHAALDAEILEGKADVALKLLQQLAILVPKTEAVSGPHSAFEEWRAVLYRRSFHAAAATRVVADGDVGSGEFEDGDGDSSPSATGGQTSGEGVVD